MLYENCVQKLRNINLCEKKAEILFKKQLAPDPLSAI